VSALVTIIHVIVCLVLIMAVLLQSGKAADLAGAFGGGGSQTAFGPRGGATLLTKVTEISAILFMITSLGLWALSGKGTSSAVSGEKAAPAKPPTAQTDTKKDSNSTPAQSVPAAVEAKDKKQPESKQPEAKPADAKAKAPDAKTTTGPETKK
jgi:preprotein translocase subunit SecG